MLFNSALDPNPWKRSAPAFFIFNTITLIGLWISFDIAGEEKYLINCLLIAVPICTICLLFMGFVVNEVLRVKYFVMVIGTFGMIPILTSCLMPFIAFLVISKYQFIFKIVLACAYLVSLIFWALIKAFNVRKIEGRIGYLDKQIVVGEKFPYIDRDRVRDIGVYTKKRPTGRIVEVIVPKLLPITVLGYPLQKLITNTSGNAATMAFLSIMSIPLSLYMTGQVAAGYMLWVYLIGCRERKTGLPILLSK